MVHRDSKHGPEIVAGRYELERLLARGGMGEVFAALDRSTGARIALKRMLAAENKDATQRAPAVHFMREYHALSALRHPRIIEVYDYGVELGRPYYTMELLDGQDLRELSPVPYREACRYLRDVASSLALLHPRRLLHRDLSPRNVRRTSAGHCKLLDFGAMVPFGVPPNLTGTPPFLAPEALQGGPLDQRSDLYSLGAVAYFVLTGRLARAAQDIAALPELWRLPLVRPKQIVRDLPDGLDELIVALLSVDAMQRPGSAAEVIERLTAVAELEPQDDVATARSFLSGSKLLGRTAPIERLRSQLNKTLWGTGATLLVCGEPGTGKSRLLAEAALLGQVAGLTVVRTVARSQAAFAALTSDVIRGLSQAAPGEAQRAGELLPALAAASGDSRAQLLRELSLFVREVAQARPLLITVDDLDRADEFSGSLIAALAHQSSECPLSIVASYDARSQLPTLAQVPGLAETVALAPLSRSQTVTLALSLFGDVPNLERVGDWLYRVALGNPKLTLQLAEHLFAQGELRYADGTWILPAEIDQVLPPSAAEALLLQLHGLSVHARALAELLCVSRAGASAERMLELSQLPLASLLQALEELVQRAVLESAGDAYAFAQRALRESLLHSLTPDRRRELHTVWAERLLSGKPTPEARLEAGWHLIHTQNELRGAEILAEIAPDWVERRVNMAVAVPALERALEIYTRHGKPLAEQLHLRSLLVMSSFLFDWRLAKRHAQATLDALYPFTGLALTERLARVLGKSAATVVSCAWTLLSWLLRPRKTRGPHVFDALKYYARASMGLVGLRALAVDVQGVREGFERMRAFEGHPHPSLRLVHALAKSIFLHTSGRGPEEPELMQDVLRRLSSPRRMPAQMNDAERKDLIAGALMLEGTSECYRQQSRALDYVEQLKGLNTPLAAATALRVSMSYHMLRGETERAHHFRRALDLNAIENGTVWQIDWISVPMEGLTGMIWSDLVMLRRALDALERLTKDEPGFSAMRDTIRIGYHFRRGDHRAVVRAGETYMQSYPPFAYLGWGLTYAQTALSYLELGDAERALAISGPANALLTAEYRRYVVSYSTLEAAHAASLIASGQREAGEQMFRALLDRLRASGEHTRACLMHEYRVKAARLSGDRTSVRAAIQDMKDAALASGTPSAVLLAASVSDLRVRGRSSPLPPAVSRLDAPDTLNETIVSLFLRGDQLFQRRAQHALQLLGQYGSSDEAYLFWMKHGVLELAAALDRRAPPPALERALAALPANAQGYQHTLALPEDMGTFRVLRFGAGDDGRMGFAAIRSNSEDTIPEALVADIGRALTEAAS